MTEEIQSAYPWVRVKSAHPKGAIINQVDFDPKTHELFDPKDMARFEAGILTQEQADWLATTKLAAQKHAEAAQGSAGGDPAADPKGEATADLKGNADSGEGQSGRGLR